MINLLPGFLRHIVLIADNFKNPKIFYIMNFFRKKTHVFASFGEKDLLDSPEQIQEKLESLLPVPQGNELRLSISENTDLSMDVLSAISFFSMKERKKGLRIVFKAGSGIIENIKFLGLSSYFDELIVGE